MKFKQFLAAALLLCTAGASAQTDVTSTYLTNADFESDDAIAVHLCGYKADASKAENQYNGTNALYWAQPVTGWTSNEAADTRAAGIFAYGSDQQLRGNKQSAPATNPQGQATGKALGLFAVWTGTIQYTQEITLQAGNYSIIFTYYNQSGTTNVTNLFGFETESKNYYGSTKSFSTGSWKEETVTFTLTAETTGKVSIGYTAPNSGSSANPMLFIDCVKILGVTDLEVAQGEALAALPGSVGDGFFTLGQATIDDFTQRINAATTVEAVDAIKDEITAWTAPALSGEWNIQNASAVFYLGTSGENVVLSEAPVAVTFEKATNGFYIKAGEVYINMKGGNAWSMSASATASTAWTFTLTDGKYTISGPNGMIGTDNAAAGSTCYGNKAASNNGTWIITEAVNEEEAERLMAKNALQAALNATAAAPTTNIGTAAFQYNAADVEAYAAAVAAAQAVLDNAASTKAELEAQTEIVKALSLELNAPEATQAYNLVFNCEGHSATGNALTLIPNPAQTQGLYGLKYLAPANQNLAQAFYFTHTTGNKYKIHAIDQDDNVRYITTQAEGYGTTWYDGIRTIDDVEKAMEVEIRPNGEGLYLLWNTGANKAIAHNGNTNNDMFTNNTANFQFVETQKPSIAINTTAAGWGTVMLPFTATLPTGVTAYSVSEIADNSLTLVAVNGALDANKPYIIEGAWDETLTGDAKGAALTYTEGLLTGVYTDTPAEAGWYVLQKQGEKVGFFQVDTEKAQPNVPANRAYLTTPTAGVKEFILDGGIVTAIKSVFDGIVNGKAYDLAGRSVQRLQKGGVYIINGTKVTVK